MKGAYTVRASPFKIGNMLYEMKLKARPFSLVKRGQKTVELRLFDEKRQLLRIGDELRFTNVENGETLTREIVGLDRFTDFFALYERFDEKAMGYLEGEPADPADMYEYYSKEEIARYGVLAISLK